MHKFILLAIAAAVLLTAIVTVTLYTVNAAPAAAVCPPHCKTDHCICPAGQRTIIHPTPAKEMPKNMTNATAGAAKNITGGTAAGAAARRGDPGRTARGGPSAARTGGDTHAAIATRGCE